MIYVWERGCGLLGKDKTAAMSWGSNDKDLCLRLRAFLDPGEAVLWAGRNKIRFGRVDRWLEILLLYSCALVALVFVLGGIDSWLTAGHLPLSPWLWGTIVVVQVALMLQFLRGAGRASPRQMMFLTDRRFGLFGWFPLLTVQGRRRDFPIDRISSVHAKVSRGASGDLVFSGKWRPWPSNACTIYDVDNVEHLARKLAKAAGVEPTISRP